LWVGCLLSLVYEEIDLETKKPRRNVQCASGGTAVHWKRIEIKGVGLRVGNRLCVVEKNRGLGSLLSSAFWVRWLGI